MKWLIIYFIAALFIFSACSIFRTIENVSRLKYRIYSATDYKILGIRIADKKSIKDFNSVELLKLTTAVIKGNLPLTFTLNIEAKNPNDGSGGYPRTDLSIQSFPWRLYLNDKETVKGNIDKPCFVPGKGETVIMPINIEFDIARNFEEKNLDDIIMFVLQLGGVNGSTSNLKLMAKPVIGTSVGKIEYPEEITIIDKNFN